MSVGSQFLQLHPADNVAIALHDDLVEGVATGHKVAVQAIAAGDAIIKYGQPIGTATTSIAKDSHVHVHNVSAKIADGKPGGAVAQGAATSEATEETFAAYCRANGAIGTRNYVGIVSSVNCSATVVRQIAARITPDILDRFPNVDGICPITHTSGCGMAGSGVGIDTLRRTLGGYIRHPNMAAVLVVGLGCETNDIAGLLRSAGLVESETLRTMSIQDAGGTRAAVEQAVAMVEQLLAIADRETRSTAPVSAIRLALQCGGSDAFSGITANPALGRAADLLVAAGGTVILGETPEIYGAEHLLLNRAESPEVAAALQERLDWWHRYAAANAASLDNNPSPGNIAGGITTVLEKSLGAVMKSGTTALRGVYQYAEAINQSGFVFMDSPGYDPCSITGEIASGANIVCFTTGRGSVFGAKPVPSIKLATNSEMAARMADDIDYDCGGILSADRTLDAAGADIFELIIATASGTRSASEKNGLGDFEFVPWQLGAVL